MKTLNVILLNVIFVVLFSFNLIAKTNEDRKVEPFTKVSLNISAKLYLTQGDVQKVTIDAKDDILKQIETKVENGELIIKTNKKMVNFKDEQILIYITIPKIESVETNGSGSIFAEKIITTEIDFNIAGSGSIEVKTLEATNVDAEIAGSGEIKLAGKSNKVNAEIAGSADIKLFDLITETAKVEIAGSGDVEINATENLDVEIAGSGSVYYKGEPKNLQSDVAGSGKLIKK